MALIFDQRKSLPQTHILIIGVGGYPYLSGGKKQQQQTFDGAQVLGQLTSPALSAEAFYKTALELEQQQAWKRPLGSIEILVSPTDGQTVFQGSQIEPATIQHIRDAYWSWKTRCDSDTDNVAIFFFCGHGLDKAEHHLLAEDFGKNPGNPWEGSFAFDMTRRAFFSCKATTQLFFIDACRQLTPDMLKTDIPSNPIEPPSLLAKDCKYNLTQKAAAANEMAYGKKNTPSFYTKALIGALKGNALTNDERQWSVDTGTIASRMNSFIALEAPDQGYPQRCISITSDNTIIIQLSQPPTVAVQVTCDPTLALAHASLSCTHCETDEMESRPPAQEVWELKVKAGIYMIHAAFNGGPYKHKPVFTKVMPPSAHQQLNCKP